MTKRPVYRCVAFLLAVWLLVSTAVPAAWAAETEVDAAPAGETVTISSEEEFLAFAQNCALDTWSQGKTFVLTADLDLAGEEFTPIPTFGGTFQGGGHTVSGLLITAAGSTMGLFRYIQASGMVRDLTVKGTVDPGGSASAVGGIAGENSGTLQDCAFQGTVHGDSMVGGIAGRNMDGGQIISCTASGTVSGEKATGGIAGRNLGLLLKCANSAGVNLTQSDSTINLMDVDAAATLETWAATDEDTEHLPGSCSDTGGIAGWSGGVVQSCVNSGAVGYPHVGYNTGGIVGRQSGYLTGCVNNGTINGRKDVGGIVGQSEPFLLLDPSGDTLERLRGELNTLSSIINRAASNAKSNGSNLSDQLEAMGSFTNDARNSSQQMIDGITDFADSGVSSVNTLVADLTEALDQITPALDDLSAAGGRLEDLSDELWGALDALDGAVGIGDEAMESARAALDELRRAGSSLTAAVDGVRSALTYLLETAIHGSAADRAAAVEQLRASLRTLEDVFLRVSQAVDALRDALKNGTQFPELDRDAVLEDVRRVAASLRDLASALNQLHQNLPALDDLRTTGAVLLGALDALRSGGSSLEAALDDLRAALDDLRAALDTSGALSGALGRALEQLQGAADASGDIGSILRRAFDTVGSAVSGLVQGGPVEFTPLGDSFRDASDGLYDALGGMSGQLSRINSAARTTGNTLASDLQAINSQFQTVSNVLLDALADVGSLPEEGLDAVVQDTSEEDIAATREGKVSECRNNGAVDGDRNVGGVAGTVAIEFDLDPEDDGIGGLSFGATYETKAVVQDCVNTGTVTAKKDCVGGLAGRMDLGTALNCQNYGTIASTSGDYVGGVAGFADASVRGCWSKCVLSGEDYIGGIAGWASRLRDCRAITTVDQGTECLGAVAGGLKTDGVLTGCCFLNTGLAGVDGVSYAGRAEPVSFDALALIEGAPTEFLTFTLTLTADGETVARLPFAYGDDLTRTELPPVPEKEDCYGVWPAFDTSGICSDLTVEAEYAPWITLLASEETDGPLALALAEGRFTNEAVLHVSGSSGADGTGGVDSVTWEITLTGGDGGMEVPLRLLNPGKGDADVWQYQDGRWVEREASRSGQYLLLTMEGPQGTFRIQPRESDVPWGTILAFAAGAGGMAVLILIAGKLRRRKQRGKPQDTSNV